MKKLQDTADLFEVSFPEYKQLRQCRSDIRLVKAVWDMVIFVKVRISYQSLAFLLPVDSAAIWSISAVSSSKNLGYFVLFVFLL